MQLLLSAITTLFVIDSPYAYLLVCFLLLLFFLHVNNEREQDSQPACCNVRSVRLARSLVLCTALWSCGVTVVTPVLPLLQPALAGVLVTPRRPCHAPATPLPYPCHAPLTPLSHPSHPPPPLN